MVALRSLRISCHAFWTSLFFALLLSFSGFSQEEGYVPEIVTDWMDAPLYVTGGANISRFRDQGSLTDLKARPGWEFGILAENSLFQSLPFLWGMEFQSSRLRLDRNTSAVDQLGRPYRTELTGHRIVNHLNFPFWAMIPAGKREKKGHVLLGANLSLRVFAQDRFSGRVVFPNDSLEIPIEYKDPGNNAVDLFGFHANLGYRYRFHPRLEAIAMGQVKAFGLSTGTQDFFSTDQRTLFFSLKLLYRFGKMEDLPFF